MATGPRYAFSPSAPLPSHNETERTMPTTLSDALREIRANRRVCEVLAATARERKEYAQAKFYAGKVEAYDVAENFIVAVRDARSCA